MSVVLRTTASGVVSTSQAGITRTFTTVSGSTVHNSQPTVKPRILRSVGALTTTSASTTPRMTTTIQTPRTDPSQMPAQARPAIIVPMRAPRKSPPARPSTQMVARPSPSSSTLANRTKPQPPACLTNGAKPANPMALSARLKPRGVLGGLLKCVYCQEMLLKPRTPSVGRPLLLPCLHTVCSRNCLDKWLPSDQPGIRGSCPLCKSAFEPSSVELHTFLMEKVTLSKGPQTRPKCETCNLEIEAVSYCKECDQMECGICTEEHLNDYGMTEHSVVTVEYGMKVRAQKRGIRIIPSPELSKCALHETPLTHHCTDCNATVCLRCKEKHNGHPVITIQKLSEERRAQLDEFIENFTYQMEFASECKKQLINRIPKVLKEEKIELIKQAKQRLEFWMNVLLKEEAEARKQIAKATVYKAKELNMKRAIMEGFIEQTKQLLTLAKNIKDASDPVVIRCNRGAMDRQVKRLNKIAKSWAEGQNFLKWTERDMRLQLHPIDRDSLDRIAALTQQHFSINCDKARLDLPPAILKRPLFACFDEEPAAKRLAIEPPPPRETPTEISPETAKAEESKDQRHRPSALVSPIKSPMIADSQISAASPTRTTRASQAPVVKKVINEQRQTTATSKDVNASASPATKVAKPKPATPVIVDLIEIDSSTDEEGPVIGIVQLKSLMEKSDEESEKSATTTASNASGCTAEKRTASLSDVLESSDKRVSALNSSPNMVRDEEVAATMSRGLEETSAALSKEASKEQETNEKATNPAATAVSKTEVSQNIQSTALEETTPIEPVGAEPPKAEEKVGKVDTNVVLEPPVTPKREGLRSNVRRVTSSSSNNNTPAKSTATATPTTPARKEPTKAVADTSAPEPKKSERIAIKSEKEESPLDKKRTSLVVPPSSRVLRRESKSDSSTTSSNAGEKETKYLRSSVTHKDGLKMKISLNVSSDNSPKSKPAPSQRPAPNAQKLPAPPAKAIRIPSKISSPPKPPFPPTTPTAKLDPLKPGPERSGTTPDALSPPKRRRYRPFGSVRRKKPNRPPLAPAPAAPVQDVKPLAVIPPAEPPTVAEPARQTLESSRNRSSSRSRRKSQKVAPTGLAAVDDGQMKISDDPNDRNEDYCAVCRDGGNEVLICCDLCPKVFHTHCHLPMVSGIPEDNWQCNICKSKEQLMEEWSSVPSLETARCDENPAVKCGNRKVDVYKIQSCGLTKKDFIMACKLLCTIYQCENSKALSVHFERYLLQNNAIGEGEALHLNAIRTRLTTGKPVAINKIEDLVGLLRTMFQQAKTLYKDVEYYQKVVQELEVKFNEMLSEFFPNIAAAKSTQ